MGRSLRTVIALAALLLLRATPAHSHPGHGTHRGFLHYFLDHGMGVGVLVAVGAFACWGGYQRARSDR